MKLSLMIYSERSRESTIIAIANLIFEQVTLDRSSRTGNLGNSK